MSDAPELAPDPLPGSMKLARVVDDDVLGRFIPKRSLPYYRERFRLLVEASGYADKPLSEISAWRLLPGMSGMSAKARLPWRETTLFNWAAFLGGLAWLAWRRAAGCWWILTAVGILIAISVAVEEFYGVSIGGYKVGAIISILLALFGTDLLLIAIVRELRSGRFVKRPRRFPSLRWRLSSFWRQP